jgi:hypothetical protein
MIIPTHTSILSFFTVVKTTRGVFPPQQSSQVAYPLDPRFSSDLLGIPGGGCESKPSNQQL